MPGESAGVGLQATDKARSEVSLVPSQQSSAMVFVLPPFVRGERLFCTSPLHGDILPRGVQITARNRSAPFQSEFPHT